MSTVCTRFLVSGRVQGVFFRSSTARVARRLNLTGYAQNLADGRVEVLACGSQDAVLKLESWLWQGSAASSVSDVSSQTVATEPPPAFVTG